MVKYNTISLNQANNKIMSVHNIMRRSEQTLGHLFFYSGFFSVL